MFAGWLTLGRSALVLALADDAAGAQKVAAELNQRFPEATYGQFYYLPAARAVLALRQGKPQEAIEDLGATSSHETLREGGMVVVYLRGQAYLDAHQGAQAAAEFQKMLDRSNPRSLRQSTGAWSRSRVRIARRHGEGKDGVPGFLRCSGKMPTPIFPFSNKPKPNTPSCNNPTVESLEFKVESKTRLRRLSKF